MKLTYARPLERLAHQERPLAAIFTSFTFDPAFFEEHILRTVLQLSADPQENAARYHDEARQALQEVPVACIVDAGMKQPGHRLPYDLLEVSRRVFHPKLTLLIFPKLARLTVGSGNLTRGGYGENTETFFSQDLSFDVPEDIALLNDVVAFLQGLSPLLRHPGTQLASALNKVPATNHPTPDHRSLAFLHSLDGSILNQMRNLIPDDVKVARVGVLAPFFEKDDETASSNDWDSVLGSLVAIKGNAAPLDLAVLWDDPPLAGNAASHPKNLAEGVNRLWAWTVEDELGVGVVYPRLLNMGARQVEMADQSGRPRRFTREEIEEGFEEHHLGLIDKITAFAPRHIFTNLAKNTDAKLWLHPAWRHEEDRARRRPLHAKLYLLQLQQRKKTSTLVVVGSPNPSHRALLLEGVAAGANVECALAFIIEEALTLQNICPELVMCPPELVTLVEREYPSAPPNQAEWIISAVHDAAARTLRIQWAESGPAPLEAWELEYADNVIAEGERAPAGETVHEPFTLLPSSCEIDLVTASGRFSVPITVADLAQLPVNTSLMDLSLKELLALLGRRVGQERLTAIRQERGAAGVANVLEALFGEGFGPSDVFRAYWSIAEDLATDTLSAQAFRARLIGHMSLRSIWLRMKEATGIESSRIGESLSKDEAWFYGAELLRTLGTIVIPKNEQETEKAACLAAFISELRADLSALAPKSEQLEWLAPIVAHYGLTMSSEVSG